MDKEAIIIIDFFVNSSYKKEIFEKTLQSVKKLNIPILGITNCKDANYLISEFDYFLYSRDNLLFSQSYEKYPMVSFFMDCDSIRFENNVKCYQKHGLSFLSNLKKATKLAQDLGFKKFIRIEWDFIICDEDLIKINKLINNFIANDKKAYFIYNPKNAYDLPDFCAHFWMVDLKFWNENFPDIHNEDEYKQFLKLKNNNDSFFEISERVIYLSFFNMIDNNDLILESDFMNLFHKSIINAIVNDINFDSPSSNGVFRGFAKIYRNKIETGELALMTWNRINKDTDIKNYVIKYDNKNYEFNHHVNYSCWCYSLIPDFLNNYPIKLTMDNNFTKEYNNSDEINSVLIIK